MDSVTLIFHIPINPASPVQIYSMHGEQRLLLLPNHYDWWSFQQRTLSADFVTTILVHFNSDTSTSPAVAFGPPSAHSRPTDTSVLEKAVPGLNFLIMLMQHSCMNTWESHCYHFVTFKLISTLFHAVSQIILLLHKNDIYD